ncbi:MAG TPA: protein-glutamate O-methyltransferase CheR [Moraxellaceae bacterium]|nr:protein-glutamate O-methyltransferase CheR [Moraxellaceae bacterium]
MYRTTDVATDRWGIKTLSPISDEQFELWQTLIEARTGMTIGVARRSFLETNLGIRMREIGINDYETYYEQLMAGPVAEREWAVLVDRLTVQETSFFRHPSSFALVRQHVSELLLKEPARKSLNLWSVGCSTGEEPYSLAMQTDAQIAELKRKVFFGVTATDISLPTLGRARTGIYGDRRLHNVPAAWKEKYFKPVVGRKEWQVTDDLKKRVAFVQLNIMELDRAPLSGMDVIFCQNVLIYFRRFRKRDILTNLAVRLAPGGLMVLGLGEAMDWAHPQLVRVDYPDTMAFRRKT